MFPYSHLQRSLRFSIPIDGYVILTITFEMHVDENVAVNDQFPCFIKRLFSTNQPKNFRLVCTLSLNLLIAVRIVKFRFPAAFKSEDRRALSAKMMSESRDGRVGSEHADNALVMEILFYSRFRLMAHQLNKYLAIRMRLNNHRLYIAQHVHRMTCSSAASLCSILAGNFTRRLPSALYVHRFLNWRGAGKRDLRDSGKDKPKKFIGNSD